MRTIDADELINDIIKYKNGFIGTHSEVIAHDEKCDYAIDMIESTETVDNMKRGHWDSVNYALMCSWCNKETPFAYESDYCPNCGAKMDGILLLQDIAIES